MDPDNQNIDFSKFFEEAPKNNALNGCVSSKKSIIKRLLYKIFGGLIKTDRQANYVLVIFFLLAMGISFFLFLKSFKVEPSDIMILPAEADLKSNE